MGKPIYLDYNATTPIDPDVRDAMLPYLEEHFGNPSTTHAYGRPAKEAVERARQQVASLIAPHRRKSSSPAAGVRVITRLSSAWHWRTRIRESILSLCA